MKTRFFVLVITVASMLLLVGCAGYRSATLETSGDGGKYKEANFSLLNPSEGAVGLARALAICKQAEGQKAIDLAIAKKIAGFSNRSSTNSQVREYLGVVINNDSYETAYIPNPDYDQLVTVTPGGAGFIYTHTIPKELVVYRKDGEYVKVRIDPNCPREYNGIMHAFKVRINRLRR